MAKPALKPTFISTDALRASLRANGDAPHAPASVYRMQVDKPKALEEGTRKVRFCFSDQSVDRMGDTIDPAGWSLHSFEKNPVALWAHDSSAPPIGRASDVRVIDGRLMGDIEFAPPETYAFADTIYRLVKDGYLNAVSVGFMALEYEWSDDDDREWGMDFKRQSLMEISVCPIPANPSALVEAGAKGFNVDRVQRDFERFRRTSRPIIEATRKIAEPPVDLDCSPAAVRARVAARKLKHGLTPPVDPRLIAADQQFRTLRW